MRRGLAWLAGLVGIAALVRAVRRREATAGPHGAGSEPAPPLAGSSADDPAAELRRRLDEARADDAGVAPGEQDDEGGSLEERRARVHARAREALDLMRGPADGG